MTNRNWRTPWFIPLFGVLALSLILVFSGCGKTKVKRVAVDEVIDLSGHWNDTDSRLVSEEMIRDFLSRTWYTDFTNKSGKKPDIIVGKVRNKSQEHINTQTFVKDLERALMNSGKVDFVASSEERTGIREEREDMDINSSDASRKSAGQEAGADYMIIGQINTIFDTESKERVTFYQVELEAVSMSNNRKIWMGQKKIKKFIERPNKKWM